MGEGGLRKDSWTFVVILPENREELVQKRNEFKSTRERMKPLLTGMIGILGFGGGVLFTLMIVDRSESGIEQPLAPPQEDAIAVLSERERGVPPQNKVSLPESAPVGGSTLEQISEAGGSVVPRQMLRRIQVKPFAPDGTVSDELAEVFSLSEHETSALNSKLRDLRERLDALEVANVTSIEHEALQTTINIQAFPEEGESLRQDFEQFVVSLLAEEGDEMIHHLLNGRSSDWGRFGEGPRVIRFGVDDSPVANEIQLVYEDGRERGSGGFTRRVSVPDFHPEIPIRYIAPEAEVFWPMLGEDLKELFTVEQVIP
jgi:hypothetical protein